MGRPRQHDEQTRAALLAAAERLVAEGGLDALSTRAVSEAAGTTTRAVYSLFGSKDGLLQALAAQAFAVLGEGLDAMPETEDPAADLIALGTTMYRNFVREHPSLYRLTFQRIAPGLRIDQDFLDARARTWVKLEHRLQRLADAGLLRRRSVLAGAVEFNAMCEGLAAAELRGGTLRVMPPGQEHLVWQEAFETLVRGFGASDDG